MAVVTDAQLQEIVALLNVISKDEQLYQSARSELDAALAAKIAATAASDAASAALSTAQTAEAAAETDLRTYTDGLPVAPSQENLNTLTTKTSTLVQARNAVDAAQGLYNTALSVTVDATNVYNAKSDALDMATNQLKADFAAFKAAVDTHVGN